MEGPPPKSGIMDPMSPTVAMSASQKAKKVSIPDDPPLLACITEVVETLKRPKGAVRRVLVCRSGKQGFDSV